MPPRWTVLSRTGRPQTTLAGSVVTMLCIALGLPASSLSQPSRREQTSVIPAKTLTANEKALHLLNRFTFGPRPGDAEALTHASIEAWFERQLHPEQISDSALDSRLARYPAMELAQPQLLQRFPTPNMLRQYSRGLLDPPADPVERAIYADAALRYARRQEGTAEGEAAGASPAALAKEPVAKPSTSSVEDGAPALPAVPPAAPAGADPTSAGVAPMDAASVRAILALPAGVRLDRLLTLSPEEMSSLRRALRGGHAQELTKGMSPVEVEQVTAMGEPVRLIGDEALSTRLLRDVYSERQLQAVMTDFWLNHFNVYARKNQNEPFLLAAYERDAILPHALGRFEDLLVADAQSPAMLVYLDNETSVGEHSRAAERASGTGTLPSLITTAKAGKRAARGINENYARELMELHTLGVNGGYSQDDVIALAKCFTGWTLTPPSQGSTFTFNPNRHEPGAKIVLGHRIEAGGENEGLEVLHLLASSPSTAHHLSEQLAERFVSDTPPPALVNRMSAAYLAHDGDISAVLRTMFHSPEFWAPASYHAKLKTPVEFLASALRATDADVTQPGPLLGALTRLGMPLYGMQTPNGYSWQADAWTGSSALVNRLNLALILSGNRLAGTEIRVSRLLGRDVPSGEASPDTKDEAHLEKILLGQSATARTRVAVLSEAADPALGRSAEASFRAAPPGGANTDEKGSASRHGGGRTQGLGPQMAGAPEAPLATIVGLLLGSPEFQRR